LHDSFDVRENGKRVRIPLGETIAAFYARAFIDLQPRAIDDAIGRTFLALRVHDHRLHVATHRDQLTVGVLDDVAVHDLDLAVIAGLDLGLAGDLRCAADVERAHRELRARLADRLRGDHADRLADIDRRS